MPGQEMVPLVPSSSPASRLSSVDFPLPEGPSSATRSPPRIENVTGSSATTFLSPVPNWRARPSALTIGSIIDDPPIPEPNDTRGGSGERLAVRRNEGNPSGRAMIAKQAYQVPLRRRVDLGGRFVGQDDAWRERE